MRKDFFIDTKKEVKKTAAEMFHFNTSTDEGYYCIYNLLIEPDIFDRPSVTIPGNIGNISPNNQYSSFSKFH